MRPGPRLVRLGVSILAALVRSPIALGLWAVMGAAILLAAALAWRYVQKMPAILGERLVPGTLALGVFTPVTLRLSNASGVAAELEVFDAYPAEAAGAEGLPQTLKLPPWSVAEVTYRLRPTERGLHAFSRIELRRMAPGALWEHRQWAGQETKIRVLPNFQAVVRYALLAVEDRLGDIGIKTTPRRGEGLEFQELREYREGDSLRLLDWKATSRRGVLISRQYQDEKNQQIVFLLDCGRRLHAKDGSLTHFDHVLNAVLLLSYVALRQGDAVGLLTFSGEIRWLPPTKGNLGLETILKNTYDLKTSTSPSDYLEAATRLMSRQKRRALVVLVTNLRDEDASEIEPALRLLRTQNLVLLASLREAALTQTLTREIVDLRDASMVASTHRYMAERERTLKRLHVGGVLTLDTEPQSLPLLMVNRYLEIKRSGAL